MKRPERPPPSAYSRALSLLGRREHSRRELRSKLAQRGVEAEEIEVAFDQLDQHDFQSDERFAEVLVRSRISQGHGPVRILAELRQHGIEGEAARTAIDAAQPDWQALADELCRRRFRGPPADYAERVKRANFLARRGFPSDVARAASGQSGDED
jgi:regulatory protein